MDKYAHFNEPQRELDLHKLTREEALQATRDFLDECLGSGVERALIITGKGKHSADGQAILRPAVEDFLRTQDVEYQKAKPNQGGDGALFVRFSKDKK